MITFLIMFKIDNYAIVIDLFINKYIYIYIRSHTYDTDKVRKSGKVQII